MKENDVRCWGLLYYFFFQKPTQHLLYKRILILVCKMALFKKSIAVQKTAFTTGIRLLHYITYYCYRFL